MKAFLLAAGRGKRLLPFTLDNPKPLIKIGGLSLIERNIEKLKKCKVDEVVINLHHFGEKIIDLLGDGSRFNIKISYSIEEKLLGTGGGILNSIHHFSDPFIVLSADTWTDFNLENLELQDNALAHMILIPNPENNPDGDVYFEENLVKEKGSGLKYTFSGLSILSPELFYEFNLEEKGLWQDILKPASNKNLVTGQIYEGKFENLNTLEDVERLDGLMGEE